MLNSVHMRSISCGNPVLNKQISKIHSLYCTVWHFELSLFKPFKCYWLITYQPIEFEYFHILSVSFHPQTSKLELRPRTFCMWQHQYLHLKWSNMTSHGRWRLPGHFCLVCFAVSRPAKFKMPQSAAAAVKTSYK